MTKNSVRFAPYLRNRACNDCHLVETCGKIFSMFQNLDFSGCQRYENTKTDPKWRNILCVVTYNSGAIYL